MERAKAGETPPYSSKLGVVTDDTDDVGDVSHPGDIFVDDSHSRKLAGTAVVVGFGAPT